MSFFTNLYLLFGGKLKPDTQNVGVTEGPIEFFDDDGNLESKMTLKDGKENGPWESYYKGNLEIRGNMKDDKEHGTFEYFTEDGELERRVEYRNGLYNGSYEVFYENGGVKSRDYFTNGKKDRNSETYYENGKMESKTNNETGFFTSQYENGHIKNRGTIKDGQYLHGLYEQFHENGKLKMKGEKNKGKNDGIWEYYDKEGNLTQTEKYKDGEVLNTEWEQS